MWRIRYALQVLKDDRGIGVVEGILILVVLIGLVIIFKSQLTSLVQTIFEKIPAKFRNLSVVSTGKKEMTTGYVRGEVTVYLTLTFYSACLACTCVDGKCIHPDGKELQKGRYEPGSGVRICGISKKNFWNIMMYLP